MMIVDVRQVGDASAFGIPLLAALLKVGSQDVPYRLTAGGVTTLFNERIERRCQVLIERYGEAIHDTSEECSNSGAIILNVADVGWNDITYRHVSRLRNEAAPEADYVVYPGVPRTLRARLQCRLLQGGPVNPSRTAIFAALASALLFGGTVPFAKLLAGGMSPLLLAGLLYLGSGLGLWTLRLVRDRRLGLPRLPPRDWWCFLGAIAAGGVIAPVLLMSGLKQTAASSASLLLNLEAVFTALMAWLIFRENTDRRLVFGMLLIVAGGAALTAPPAMWLGGTEVPAVRGALFIAGACACWAIDNNLTRRVSLVDADFIAGTKGLAAGMTNLLLAVAWGAGFPPPSILLSAMALGLLGYGVSLMLFVVALRGLGAARAGAYFSTAPFLGAAIAIIALHEPTHPGFWLSALLMAAGVAIHMTERHTHEHTHEALVHSHVHTHDAHHRHEHPSSWDGVEPHSHEHGHEGLTHEHAHFPDLHHRHGH